MTAGEATAIRSDRSVDRPGGLPARRARRWPRPGPWALLARWLPRVAVVAVIAPLALAAFFDLVLTSQGWDAHTLKAWAERADRLGSGLYTASANQRGPLWLLLYMAPLRLAGPLAYWFVIAAIILAVAALTVLAVGAAVRWRTGSAAAASVTAAALGVYLVLGPEEYSQVLYSRNLSIMLTAGAFALLWPALASTEARRSAACLVAGGACAGLAVQTLPTSALSFSVMGVALWASLWRAHGGPLRAPVLRRVGAWAGALVAVFASAPLYFAVRGRFADFWSLYWDYNLVYSAATGRSLGEQLGDGLADFRTYYADHPFFALVVVAFVAVAAARWRGATPLERTFDLTLVGWWALELLAVTLAQRFFPHYLVLPLVPVAVMGGVVLGRLGRAVPARSALLLAAVAAALVAYTAGYDRTAAGWEEAARFSGLQEHADRHFLSDARAEPETAGPPLRRGQRAFSDVVTSRDDYVWVWSDWPGYYTNVDRPPATRYLSRHWLLGGVYGGTTSPDNILPGTFERWADDVRRTPPAVFMLPAVIPPPEAGTVDRWLRANYTSTYSGSGVHMLVRNDRHARLRDLLAADARQPATLSPAEAATTSGAVAVSAGGVAGAPRAGAAVAVELPAGCAVVSARMVRDASAGSSVVVSLVDRARPGVAAEVALLPDAAVSRRSWPDPASVEGKLPLGPAPAGQPEELRVLVNGRSALVAVDGAVVGAVRSTSDDAVLVLSSGAGSAVVTDVKARALGRRQWPACARG